MSHKKFGPDRFSRFDVYWIQTNKQTDKPNLYIDVFGESNLKASEKNRIKALLIFCFKHQEVKNI